MQHAHVKGVVHRDLKPSNILVARHGERSVAKVIDFGIAKAIADDPRERLELTRFGQVVGTPQYMSPEQAGSSVADIDTRADIYALGVILYELLVGSPPLDIDTLTATQDLSSALWGNEPQKPSTRYAGLGDRRVAIARRRATEPAALTGTLRGDLDCIVMQAMAKERSRRYQTANALALDLRRLLEHAPIEARPPSPAYLFGRFVRRNRAAVVATVSLVVLGSLALFVGASGICVPSLLYTVVFGAERGTRARIFA